MNMESPVRICLGAALVVNILLFSTTVSGNALPQTTSTTLTEYRVSSSKKLNNTWAQPITPDVSLNELNPKETTSEEHTEKNAKYKDRGRVRFHSQLKSSTENPLRRVRMPTDAAKLIVVTPTAEVKRPAEIIDSMKEYKKTKLPLSSSTTPVSIKEVQSVEEYGDEEEEEENEAFEKFTSNKFHDGNFFTIPSFDDDENESSNNKVKQDFSSPSYGFSSFFPKEASYGYNDHSNSNNYKSNSFFDFDTELTTPKNDFFDKKYQEISGSIIKHLDLIKAKSPPPNVTNVHKIVKENVGLEKLSNDTPSNKSTVFIKNTKEIRLLDNEGADTAKKELSDVKGTSVYYEMSVLSTETYINHSNDEDCDNDTVPSDPTVSTTLEEELASIKAAEPALVQISTKPPFPDPIINSASTLSPNLFPISSASPIFNPFAVPVSTQNSISSTERTTKIFSSSFSRNRNYSKRLNLTGVKDSPNSVTSRTDISSYRPQSHKFHYTTPKLKPIWMSPRRNVTRISYARPTHPTTIYSEHFNIKDKYTTTLKPKQPSRAILTTVSSEKIDPVLQSDISGPKKVVHSQSISDNSIPSLWKRGSTKFATSTATSSEVSEMEIPPTSIAWALASLRLPSSVNNTGVTKSVDENELQNVGESIDKKETTTSSTTTTVITLVSSDVPTKVTEVDQNKLPWQPIFAPTSPGSESDNETTAEVKSEKQAAESNISIQSSAEPITTETVNKLNNISKVFEPAWIPATEEVDQTTVQSEKEILPVDATRSIGFESITKLPSDVTTPQDETVASSEVNNIVTQEMLRSTTDYEITTIRFSYVPTEAINNTEENTDEETSTPDVWPAVTSTRTKMTKIKDSPITTYRPVYMSTTEVVEETTTFEDTTPPVIEVSSQVLDNVTEKILETTEMTEEITFEPTTEPITVQSTTEVTTTPTTTEMLTEQSTTEMVTEPTTTIITTQSTPITTTTTTQLPTTTVTTTTEEDTTTIIVEVVTSINTERERKVTTILPSTTVTEASEMTDCVSEENSNSNEVITQEAHIEPTTTLTPTTERTTQKVTTEELRTETVTAEYVESTTQRSSKIFVSVEDTTETEFTTKAVNDLEDLTSYAGDMTTEASSRVLPEESEAGAAVAIAVSTIGVIALVLLIGLLLVVRRRGRRGIYAQRCTPVSLDAYSLDSVSVGHRKGHNRLRASKRSYGNPAYDDEVTSHPMQYSALASFALDIDSISAEFAEIPSVTVRPEEVPLGCEDKNRYSNVLPLPETRVPLVRIGSDSTTEYINANYITGPGNIRKYYILCQAPLSNTVVDFWRMIWEQNSRLVVMLTEYMENGVEKCYEYLPPSEISDNKRIFGDFKIILKKREQRDKYAISSVQLINLNTRTWREITHLWYFWPAKGVPDDYDSIIDFLSEMRSYMKVSQTAKEYDEEGVEVIYGDQNRSSFNNLVKLREDSGSSTGVNVYSPAKVEEMLRRTPANNGTLGRMKAASEIEGVRPCVVTCASGAGRSAALVALDVCARALAATPAAPLAPLTPSAPMSRAAPTPARVDVPRVVRHLRAQRPHSLSNRHHYIFLYKVLSEYGNKLMGGGVESI